MSPVRTSIPKGAHALVEVNGRRDVVCVPRSPTLVRKDTDGCLDVKNRNCHWHRESHKNETWRIRSDMLHCALQTLPWSTEAAVCSTVRLQSLPTTSTRNCNCETFPRFSAHLNHCQHNNWHIHNLSRDCICGTTTDFCTSGPMSAQ